MKKSSQPKGANIRKCAGCGLRADKSDAGFLRVALPKDGAAHVDLAGTSPGRGAYVCRDPECVRKVCKSRRLSSLLRGSVPETVYQQLRREVGLDV